MSDDIKDRNENILDLLDVYSSAGEVARYEMAKDYPHIDFNKLNTARNSPDIDFKEVIEDEGFTYTPPVKVEYNNDNVQSGNIWIKVLEFAAWLSAIITIGAGIISAGAFSDLFGGGVAFAVFLISASSALIALAGIMVFLNMAKDISNTAKDTSEIKEILKNRSM